MNECCKHALISLPPDIVSRHIEARAGSKFSFELVSQIHMACCTLSMRPNSTNLHQLKDSNQLRDFKFIRCKEMIRGQNTKHFTYQVISKDYFGEKQKSPFHFFLLIFRAV